MMMKCKRCQNLIMRHFDHALLEDERKQLERHLDSCPKCRSLMADLQGIMQTLETARPLEPPSGMEQLVMNRIQSLPESPAHGPNNLITALYGSMSAAAVMLACAVAMGLGGNGILTLVSQGAAGLNSFLEQAWNFQIVYNLLSVFFSQMIFSIVNTIQAVYVIAGFAAIVVGIKKLVLPGPAFQKSED